jgi:hypothetical protein
LQSVRTPGAGVAVDLGVRLPADAALAGEFTLDQVAVDYPERAR